MMNTLDLFAGIGGFSLGLERTGHFRTVAFCEIDKKAQKVLNKHWPDVPVFEDVSALTKDTIDEAVGVPIHVITGGFPCQDISLAGRGAGLEGERSGLWFQYKRLIEEIRPRYAIIENVSALRSRGLDQVLGSLAQIGYDAEWHCIPAAAVGAPHRRDRIWIVAYPSVPVGSGAEADTQHPDSDSFGSHRATVNVKGSVEPRDKQVSDFGSMGEVLADADNLGPQRGGNAGVGKAVGEKGSQPTGSCSVGLRGDVDDAECVGRIAGRQSDREDDGDQPSAASQHSRHVADTTLLRWRQGQQDCGGGEQGDSAQGLQRSGFGRGGDVADADRISGRPGESEGERGSVIDRSETGYGRATLADCIRARLEGYARYGQEGWLPRQDGPAASQGVCRGEHPGWWWAVEPDVGRVAHGVPNRVDRLKQLGNAVVPQLPQIIGEALIDWENGR